MDGYDRNRDFKVEENIYPGNICDIGTLNIPGIPFIGPGTQTARANLESANRQEEARTRAQLQSEIVETKGLKNESSDGGRAVEVSSERREYSKPLPVTPLGNPAELNIDATYSITEVSTHQQHSQDGTSKPKEPVPKQQHQSLDDSYGDSYEGRGEMERGKDSEGASGGGGGGRRGE
ncbi:hypothetical protein Btru_057105 [Bulinus truncatus]|nr:hypothetical protein Btru_057105 [Bulinus truncatus]